MSQSLSGASDGRGLTARVAACALGWVEAELPTDADRVGRALLRDGVGVLLAGADHPAVRLLAALAREDGALPRAPVYRHSLQTSPAWAAMVNGTATHALDFEPMFDPPTHVVSPILSALLALAHATPGLDGRRFLVAFIAGVQLQADLRRAAASHDATAADGARHFPFQAQGFHPPGPVGALGSALAAGVLLGMAPDRIAAALAIAASRASGISGNIGTMVKSTHCGHAARVGLESALAARLGMTAADCTLSGPAGWGEVFGGAGFQSEAVLEGMRTLRAFSEPGFAIKRWPAHTAMQPTITAALQLYDPRASPASVRIVAPALRYCDRPLPRDGDAARFSFQFVAAAALLDGRVDEATFTTARLSDPAIQRLLRATTLTLDPEIPVAFTQMRVTVEVDGKRRVTTDRWRGHWKEPAGEVALREKFLSCVRCLGAPAGAALSDALMGIDRPGALAAVLETLGGAPTLAPAEPR